MKRKLQVAIDVASAEEALAAAKMTVAGGVDVVEAGAPLIKKEGIGVVKRFKGELGVPILADLKIIDFGATEARLAFDASADVVTVLGSATTSTIRGAVEAARAAKTLERHFNNVVAVA